MASSLRQFLICAILLSAFVAVYSLEDAAGKSESQSGLKRDLIQTSDASEMARKRRHRFGHHLCKNWFYSSTFHLLHVYSPPISGSIPSSRVCLSLKMRI